MKRICQRIKRNHLLLLTICCLAPMALIISLVFLFKGAGRGWFWLIILLCPLLHIWMMKGVMGGKHSHCGSNNKNK